MRDLRVKRVISVGHVCGKLNPSDGGTKVLPKSDFVIATRRCCIGPNPGCVARYHKTFSPLEIGKNSHLVLESAGDAMARPVSVDDSKA